MGPALRFRAEREEAKSAMDSSVTLNPETEPCAGAWPKLSAAPRPTRPGPIVEMLGSRLLQALAPKTAQHPPIQPPDALAPWTSLSLATKDSRLNATWFPASGLNPDGTESRGTVVLAHPWVPGGQGYFFRRSRLRALRQAGFNALTFDFPGFGDSERWKFGFLDRDLTAVLDVVDNLTPRLAKYFWGVSAGGYWGHLALSSRSDVSGAVFEETPIHLIDWSDRVAPERRLCHSFYRQALGSAYRFLDLRGHAASLNIPSVSYVSGLNDPGILPQETKELARLAGGRARVVANAGHLDVIKRDGNAWIPMALDTFSAP